MEFLHEKENGSDRGADLNSTGTATHASRNALEASPANLATWKRESNQ